MRRFTGGRRTAAGVVLLGLLALSGCGGGGHAGAAASPTPSGMTDAQLQVLVNNLVQCVRQHGAPGMPDVTVRSGHVLAPDMNTVDQTTQQNFPAARQACQAVENRIPPGVLDDNQDNQGAPTAADVPKLREFAKCMRANGQPDWPDPNPDGTFPGPNQVAAQGKQALAPAIQACQQYWSGQVRFAS